VDLTPSVNCWGVSTTTDKPPLPVGPELRRAREQTGLSRETLARLASCSSSRITQFEQGMRPAVSPALSRVWRVLTALGAGPREEVMPRPGTDGP
jgi:transcriptional regulator with XRE-family HTH domain